MKQILKKIPWGVLAGVFGILCFYLTIAVFGVHFVFIQVKGQAGQTATLFDTGWQTLLFVLDVIFIIAFIAALALFILNKVIGNKERNKR